MTTDLKPLLLSAGLCVLLGTVASAGDAAQVKPLRDSSSSGEPEKADVSPRGHRPATDISYGDWRKICFKAAGATTLCRTSVTGKFDTGQIAVRIDLIEREGGQARLQLFLPVGMYLQPGVKLSVDKAPSHAISYTWCLTNGCVAADVATPELIKEIETGETLTLELVDTNIRSVTTSVPLARFAEVRNGTPERTFEQDIDE